MALELKHKTMLFNLSWFIVLFIFIRTINKLSIILFKAVLHEIFLQNVFLFVFNFHIVYGYHIFIHHIKTRCYLPSNFTVFASYIFLKGLIVQQIQH